jgi:PAS domain S-box-containing protein
LLAKHDKIGVIVGAILPEAHLDNLKSKYGARIERLFQVNHPDPDVARRGRLLNILLLPGMGTAVVIFAVIGLILNVLAGWSRSDEVLLFVISVIGVGFVAGTYVVNRSGRVRQAAILFLVGSVVLITFSDEPAQIVSGRSTMMYILPIVMASVLLRPSSSFVVAAVSSLMLFALALFYSLPLAALLPTLLVEIVIFMVIALVSWLSARSLEQALADLRVINTELDRRVADRTRDLAEALIRVQLESSKNQAILESIADGVIVFDQAGQATLVNPAVSKLLSLPPNQIIGYKIETLMAGTVAVGDQEAVLGQVHSQESSTRLSGLRFQWGKKTLSASFAPIQIQQTVGRGTVAVFRDFTREAELENMKSMLVSMVSHELRTPLGAIIGYGEILQEQIYGPLTERQTNLVERLIANAQRLVSLVNDLLDRARLEAGKLKLQHISFSPRQLLDDLLSTTTPIAKAKHLEVVTHIAPTVPGALQGDPQRLLQILINLVGNAIKFTDQGAITVKLDRPDEAHWSLQVSDTGMGISPDEQEHVFDVFQQADSSVTRQHGGAGLGLSIVKQLTTLMGGSIELVSAAGQGSLFTVTLPLNTTVEEKHG